MLSRHEEPRGWEGERMNRKILHLQQCGVSNRIQAFAGNSRGACGSCQIGLLYCCQVRILVRHDRTVVDKVPGVKRLRVE